MAMDKKCFHAVLLSFVFIIWIDEITGNEDGSLSCVDGKWRVDTKLMALVMTCPLPLDGNQESVMKLAKCAMNKLGVYDGQNLSKDFMASACNLFSKEGGLREGCLSQANYCSFWTGLESDWENRWPLFLGCFIPWGMRLCNI